MSTPPSLTSTYTVRSEVVDCELEGGHALLDLNSSEYYSLNTVGATIWASLAAGHSLEKCLDAITDKFDVSRTDASDDLLELVASLEKEGLIERQD